MAMKKKSGGGGANWMDTYGDMVTLLMCFFVLLFSMSTMDQEKIIQLVMAFNPDALENKDVGSGNPGDTSDLAEGMTQSEVNKALDELYDTLQAYAATEGAAAEGMSVTKGDGFVFIALNDAVFFEGNSPVLLPDGKAALDMVADMLAQQADYIDELRVLGHTAQGSPGERNSTITDRYLSANRSTEVLIYLQEKGFLDPARMVSMSYGQWRPVATNDTSEGRAQNRRVEIIVSGLDLEEPQEGSITKYYTERGTENPYPDGNEEGALQPEATGGADAIDTQDTPDDQGDAGTPTDAGTPADPDAPADGTDT